LEKELKQLKSRVFSAFFWKYPAVVFVNRLITF